MSQDSRFLKGKARLIQNEQIIQKERSIYKRLGKTLPEETVTIPKIGEWELSEDQPQSVMPTVGPTPLMSPTKSPMKVARSVPMTRVQNNRNSIYTDTNIANLSPHKPVNPHAPPYLLHPPRIMPAEFDPLEKLEEYPPGTVTTELTDIIKSKYRSPKRPLPPLRDRDEDETIPFLPLEIYDDSTYEEFSLEELLKDPHAVSHYKDLDGHNDWEPCTILNYDQFSGLFLIEWDKNKRRKKVSRFNLRFNRENPEKFERRIYEARKACAKHESYLRFESRVAQIPTGNMAILAEEDILNIHSQISQNVDQRYFSRLRELDAEVEQDFKLNNCRLQFEHELEHNQMIPNRDEFLTLIAKPVVYPSFGLVVKLDYDYPETLQIISETHLMANHRILDGLLTIWGIFQDSEALTFLSEGFPGVVTLEQYIEKQNSHLESVTKTFKDSIQETLEGVITSTVSDSMNTNKAKEKKRYQNMITLTQRMLHTVLLRIAETTLNRFHSLFSKYHEKDPEEKIDPQFDITLTLNEDSKLRLVPSNESFTKELDDLLSRLDLILKQLPQMISPIVEVEKVTISFDDCMHLIELERGNLDKDFSKLLADINKFVEDHRFLEKVLALDPETYAETFDPDGKQTLVKYREELTEFQKILNEIQAEMTSDYSIGIFKLSCKEFKQQGSDKIRKLISNFLSRIKKFALQSIGELKDEFDEINDELKKIPHTPEELSAMKQYLEKVFETIKIRNRKMQRANEQFSFLEEYHFEITNDEFQFRYATLQMPQKISVMMNNVEKMLDQERIVMIRELRSNQRKLENETVQISEQLKTFATKYNDLELTIEAVDQVNEMYAKLQHLMELQAKYNSHEKLFEFEQVTSKVLSQLVDEFMPLHILWNLANDWLTINAQWMDTPFPQIRADVMNQFIIQANRKITKLRKDLASEKMLLDKVIAPLNSQIEAFKQRVPLITKLKHPGIKTKHWEQISEVVGFSVLPSMELNLHGFLDLNLEKWSEPITEIASIAAQEYNLESSLDQMDGELQQKQFETVMFRETNQYIHHNIDDIISTIDDQLVTTQTLLTSPFIGPIKKRATERLLFLRTAHETLDNWITCQRSWLYLQPIFTGTSIQKKLFKEARDWGVVDKIWSDTMKLTHNHPDFMNVMHRDTLASNINTCNELLDSITKGLNAYLESERLGFPRFFFLSNDELIFILSHTKEFDKIQESMQKLFEYVNSITVTPDMIITHMNDSEGEKVRLFNEVDGDTAEISEWLNAFEEEMKNTLKEYVRDALGAHSNKKKEQWISQFPAQVILITNQILWTQQVTNVLKGQKLRGLKLLQTKFVEQLEQLTSIVHQPISKLVRQVVSCLLINEVHNRDIISNLIENDVSDIESFKWMQQLRYYWEEDSVIVRSINNQFEYSYEYAGNSTRLVITPLTDRCYQTLLSAFKQYLSGAPSGPAGTGKTETVRDCAKALGRACVVYNCSEEVTPEQMSQFFAGLSSSGNWSCFDEFNRINIEVLSVIAQQVRTIQNAIAKSAETFILDTRTLKLNTNAAICITMNPGYAGRTELPDNLKALFRPCAMMVPDFGFICEILLFSGGFKKASMLSIKMVSIFDLCRKQLSNQHHYDWGLRAMKAILSTAGNAKRNDLNKDEALLLVQTINDNTSPRLVSADLPLFHAILKDVFPEVNAIKQQPEKLLSKLREAFHTMECQPLNTHMSKCIEFYETTLVRHGIMLVGGSMGGKTIAWKVLQRAMNVQAEVDSNELSVHVETLNPKSISIAELYGFFNPITSEWADGVLSQSIRQCSFSEQNEHKWIIVDGPVDSLWIESMNSLLDDNKVLCLPNNERIQLGPKVKMVFEVDDLSQASPATVSRCGMIYFDPSVLPWNVLTQSWSFKYEEQHPALIPFIRNLFEKYLPSMVQFQKFDAKTAMPYNPNFSVQNMLRILDCYIPIIREPVKQLSDSGDDWIMKDILEQDLYRSIFSENCTLDIPIYNDSSEGLNSIFERIFIFALIWTFGGILSEDSRKLFDKFLKDKMNDLDSKVQFSTKASVFDYYADIASNQWTLWTDGEHGMNIDVTKPIEQIHIPTQETIPLLFFSRLLSTYHHHVLIHGPDSGKTLVCKSLLNDYLDHTKFDCHNLPISHSTKPENIIKFIQGKMHKKKGSYCPLTNQYMVFLLDNLGSPMPEIYGAQPPLELIRQYMDYDGWFNTKNVEFTKIIDTTFICTMGIPGGGLFKIPERLTRHFFTIHAPKYSTKTTKYILTNLMTKLFCQHDAFVINMVENTVEATVELYKECCENLLPIPSKLYYVFGIRDIVKVIKGIMLCPTDYINTESEFITLWHHEMMRVFYDRFNTHNDRKWFKAKLDGQCSRHFSKSWESIHKTALHMFNEFAGAVSQKYTQVKLSKEELLNISNQMLLDHNRDSSKQLDIVLFSEAIEHLSNLSRIFTTRGGHAMLVGVKSSGRKSLARLALHMASIDTYEISITRAYGFEDWRNDLKNLMKQCGSQDIATGFILTDIQLMNSFQLEDISNLLVDGELPQLFENEEKDQIRAEMNANELTVSDDDIFELFMKRVKQNLHIILVFSPFGSVFKEVMLYYPAIRNCTTMDYYMPWSQNALESVALASLTKAEIGDPEEIKKIVTVCVRTHKSVEDYAAKFLKETKRFTSVTPSRYFELLNTFVNKLCTKKKQNSVIIKEYENGIEQINTTSKQIEEMSKQLDHDIPVLKATRAEVEDMLRDMQIKQGEVEETRKEVQKKSEVAEAEAAEAGEANRIAQEQFALAQPILAEAQEAVQKLDKDSLVQIKKLHAPTAGMKDTFEAVCIMFGRQPRKVEGSTPGVKEDDYWPEAVVMLNDVQFIKNVTNFRIESITKETINKLRKYVPANKTVRAEKRKAALQSFGAVAALYDWVCASFEYWFVYQEILPKKQAADEAAKKLAASEAILAAAREHLAAVEAKLQELQNKVKEMQDREAELTASVGKTQSRLLRAQKLLSGLSGETNRWGDCASNLRSSSDFILGDSLLISGVLTYIGAFSPSYRNDMLSRWKTYLNQQDIKFSENFTIDQALGNDGAIRDWIVKGLPNDTHSIENALIITSNESCYPLMIDPQLSGTKWLRAVYGEELNVLRFDQQDFLQRFKSCVSFGLPVLVTNVGLKLDPLIDPILSREILVVDGQKRVAIGGESIPYSDKFRLFISTKYPNPHYTPEVCSQVTLINFTTTQDGLTDLLLNNLIEVEREDLEHKRIQIMEANAENMMKLKEIEKEILQIVSNAGSDILDDDNALDTLQKVQKTSSLIAQQMAASETTEKQIQQFKQRFSFVAERAALLYFCVADFNVIDPMYQFSLVWFVHLFRNAIQKSEHPADNTKLINAFNSSIARTFYQSVSFSLFSRHKLLFSSLMTIRILVADKKISRDELAFILSPTVTKEPKQVPYISDEVWSLLGELKNIAPVYNDLVNHMLANENAWKKYIASKTPETDQIPYDQNLSSFQRFLILRIFHLERVREGLHIFIQENLGPEFVKPPTLNLMNIFSESDPLSPLIFIIMPGIDPQDEIINVCASMELEKYLKSYSLGRGRGNGAEELILDAAEKGFIVLLQNCHLSLSWMPRLEFLINNLDPDKTHSRFRICLVTMSSPEFPIGILYQGTKLIYEIPKGMRENVMRIYNGINAEDYNMAEGAQIEKQLIFHLAFFHAVVLERLQFNSIGWNIPYEFNPSDFAISKRHLKVFLNEAPGNDIPFEALSYVIGELNYGGRVTDAWDRRLLLSLLQRYFSEEINSSKFSFGDRYKVPDFNEPLETLIDTIESWPVVTAGEDVGLSANASTITARNEAMRIFSSLIEVQPTLVASSESISEEQFALKLIDSLQQQLPKPFNINNFLKKFDLKDTLSIVLHHELLLYNNLLDVISHSLDEMQKGLKGLILIDEKLELLQRRLLSNKIPEMWLDASFPSILELHKYMDDLKQRIEFIDNWVRIGTPIVFRLGAFFHPEEFLTSVLQLYARKHVVPFDSLSWKTIILNEMTGEKIRSEPDEGIYIEGLPLEGAKWDLDEKTLTECGQNELTNYLPIIHLEPTQEKKPHCLKTNYECPVFRTQNRGTGALDLQNYIVSLFLPTKGETPNHWVQRSVAAFITVQ